MKKRYHTYQLNEPLRQLNINRNSSESSVNMRLNEPRPLAYEAREEYNRFQRTLRNSEEASSQEKEDRLSESELKTFTFRCIETIANLANINSSQTVTQALENLIRERLTGFVTLLDEYQVAKNEFQEYRSWSKKFIASVQPLINENSGPVKEVTQLTAQAAHCAERCMLSKYKADNLRKRIDYIIESSPLYIHQTGIELQLPNPVMATLANTVKKALSTITQD